MAFIPYLHFPGTCAEAMRFYAALFGATDLQMLRYADAPPGTPTTGAPERIMHSQFTGPDGAVLMASDYPQGGPPQQAVSVMLTPATAAEARGVFDRLAEGGQVKVAFGPTFFSPGFGMLTDRFGTNWILGARGA